MVNIIHDQDDIILLILLVCLMTVLCLFLVTAVFRNSGGLNVPFTKVSTKDKHWDFDTNLVKKYLLYEHSSFKITPKILVNFLNSANTERVNELYNKKNKLVLRKSDDIYFSFTVRVSYDFGGGRVFNFKFADNVIHHAKFYEQYVISTKTLKFFNDKRSFVMPIHDFFLVDDVYIVFVEIYDESEIKPFLLLKF